MKINFPYKVKNTTAKNTFIKPADSHSLKTLCDRLHRGYSELVEQAIDNRPVFINKGLSHTNAQGKKCVSPARGEGLRTLFAKKHPGLAVNPNPKNTKGEKGQSMYRLINGNLDKLYRVRNQDEDLSIEMLDMLNKMNSMIAEHVITVWESQDLEVIEKKIPVQEHKQEEMKKDDFLARLESLQVDHYNPEVQLQNQKDQAVLENNTIFESIQ